MNGDSRRSGVRMVSRLVVSLALLVALVLGAPLGTIAAQVDPDVRDRVVPAIVEIAIDIDATANGSTEARYLPVGSGTIVSPDGLILTNWHVVDMAAHQQQLDAWEAQATADGESLACVLHEDRVLVLGTDGASVPVPMYTAAVVSEDHALDLAVLRITGDEYGTPLSDPPALPFVSLGDSSSVRQGDPIDLFGYPMIGGESLTYTDGVVSGFDFEEGIDGPAWITTNATMSGGSSGGAALDRAGRLIGVPTQGTELDCRPGDTNQDGVIDEQDVGCIPVGGSIGQLRPIALALPILANAGLAPGTVETEPSTAAVAPTPMPPVATVDMAPADPAAATSYVYAEDYCRTGPIYPPGTLIELPRDASHTRPDSSVHGSGRVLSYANIPIVPAGTVVEITGPYVESGVCDLWPIRYRTKDGVDKVAYLDEWDLSPEFPNQVAPLPPEWQSISSESEEFCRLNPSYAEGDMMVLSHDSPHYSYRRGYGFDYLEQSAAGIEWEIAGAPIETGDCDMWPVERSIPSPTTGGLVSDATYVIDGYIHEADFQTASTGVETDSE